MDPSRRFFLKNFCISKTVKLVEDVCTSFKSAAADASYFESFETSYPLISEYSYFIDDEVETLGIETEGKSRVEIAEEVYRRRGKKGGGEP